MAALSGTGFSGWTWALWCVGLAAIIVNTTLAMAASGELRRGRGRGRSGGLSGHGREDDGPACEAAHQWPTLVVVSWLMPKSAGRRWLTEAESLLSEIAPARRGAAIRSYLLSAPLLLMTMWAHEAQRRTRLGPRRPG